MINSSETRPGILAIWQDCAPGEEPELERWYQTEHLKERVGVPGFLRGRRYEAVAAPQGYFTYYETSEPAVLVSSAYLERLDSPTPLTRRVMSGIIRNMSRTICRLDHRLGVYSGACAVTVQLGAPTSAEDLAGVEGLADSPGFARLELWNAAEEAAPTISAEEKARGGDRKIAACLLIETLRESEAHAVATEAEKALQGRVAEIGIYRLICELEKRDLQAAALPA